MQIIRNAGYPFLFSYFPILLFSNSFSAKEETGGMGIIHQPGYGEAARHADYKRDKQEDEACGVELQVGDKLLAEDGEDGGEDVKGETVAAEETDPPTPFRGSKWVEPKQGGDGEIGDEDFEK